MIHVDSIDGVSVHMHRAKVGHRHQPTFTLTLSDLLARAGTDEAFVLPATSALIRIATMVSETARDHGLDVPARSYDDAKADAESVESVLSRLRQLLAIVDDESAACLSPLHRTFLADVRLAMAQP